MRKLNLKLIAITLVLFISTSIKAQSSPQPSYFTKSLITSILAQEGCTGIRMYPARDLGKNVNVVLIVGIDASGNEIYNANSPYAKYHMFSGVKGSVVNYASLDPQAAQAAVNAYFQSNPSFASKIAETKLESLISGQSQGIVIQYVVNEGSNFAASAYQDAGGPKPYGSLKPGDPCPTVCGEPTQYLIFPAR